MTEYISFSSTSSGANGWSTLSAYLECPAKAHTDRKVQIERGSTPRPLYEETKGKPVAATVGSIYGELMQRWMSGKPIGPRTKFQWDGVDMEATHPATCAEARRLVDSATAHYGSLAQMGIGELVATEMPITIPESLFGLEITGNIDLVLRTPEGIWIRDIKTEGREEASLRAKFSLRHQLWVYALGYEIATGEKPVGVGIDCCIKTATPKFFPFNYDALTERRFKWLAESVTRVKAAMEAPTPKPQLGNCYSYSKPCRYYLNDMCSI